MRGARAMASCYMGVMSVLTRGTTWVQGIQMGTNVALDLDERPMPRGPIFPRCVVKSLTVACIADGCGGAFALAGGGGVDRGTSIPRLRLQLLAPRPRPRRGREMQGLQRFFMTSPRYAHTHTSTLLYLRNSLSGVLQPLLIVPLVLVVLRLARCVVSVLALCRTLSLPRSLTIPAS